MKTRKYIIDTTLRDGEQSPGVALNMEDKMKIAKLLDGINVYEIEAGIPAMSKLEAQSIYNIVQNRKNSCISVWSRMNKEDILKSIECCPDIIHIGAPVSYVQIYTKLKKNKVWFQKTLAECVEAAITHGVEVTVGFEDASRADIGFMISMVDMLKVLGVNTIRVADTVGVFTPNRTKELVKTLIEHTEIDIEIHVHNDIGMAVANSIEGAKAGAKYIDCTLFGIGERTGNCNMYDFVHAADAIYDCGMSKSQIIEVQNQLRDVLCVRK
jgi:homocitrate synthase NifV